MAASTSSLETKIQLSLADRNSQQEQQQQQEPTTNSKCMYSIFLFRLSEHQIDFNQDQKAY
jgi:hypothetical protein